jgi:hypothetical protein
MLTAGVGDPASIVLSVPLTESIHGINMSSLERAKGLMSGPQRPTRNSACPVSLSDPIAKIALLKKKI